MKKISTNEENQIYEKAIKFLIDEYHKSGNNPKPVILHSLRLAFYLLEKGYSGNIIIAAILHDLLEDSNITDVKIGNFFGNNVASIVSAVSFKPNIKDKKVQYQEMFRRTLKEGNEAMILKCADIYDNSFYIHLVKNKEKETELLEKMEYFLNISQKTIGNEPVWKSLKTQFTFESKRIQ